MADIHPEHAHIIQQTKASMPSDEVLVKVADVLKLFGDPTRIRILAALSEGEMCVCCICDLLGMSQSAVSHQLSILKAAKLIKAAGRASKYTTPLTTPMWVRYSAPASPMF